MVNAYVIIKYHKNSLWYICAYSQGKRLACHGTELVR